MTFNGAKAHDFLLDYKDKVEELTQTSKYLKDLSNYTQIEKSIEKSAASKFGYVDVHFFGSRIIGLATNESDLDIFVDVTGDKFYKTFRVSPEHDANYRKLASAIDRASDWIIKEKVLRASVPIIITVYRPTLLNCDINIANGLGVANSKLITHLFEIQPEAVKLFHFLKLWFTKQSFEGLKGYPLALLVIFYLQQINLMPSVKTIQLGLSRETIDGWEIQFDRSRTLSYYGSSQMISYKSYVKGFFKLYKDFAYNSFVISPYSGEALNVASYKAKHPKFLLKGLFIAGPVNAGKNCGIVDSWVKTRFVDLCKASHDFEYTSL